jgi:hypothetical protein
MEKKIKCIEIRTNDGKVILSLYLSEKEIPLKDEGEKDSDTPKEPGTQRSPETKTDEPMTDAQKRYLFRILAEQGIEGDKAHQYLKNLFQVDSLKEVSKLEASRMIERLLEENQGGEDSGSPF